MKEYTRNASTDDLRQKAYHAAMGKITRGIKEKHAFYAVSSARRTISASYKQLAQNTKKLPISFPGSILENHYIINKAQGSLSHLGRQMARERFTFISRSRGKRKIRALDLCEQLLNLTSFRLDYASLSVFLHAYQEIAPLDESEILMLPLYIRMICTEHAAELYAQAASVSQDIVRAKKYHDDISRAQSERARDELISSAAEKLSDSGRARLYTLFADNDDFPCIEIFSRELEHRNTGIRAVAVSDRKILSMLSEKAVSLASTLRLCDSLSSDRLLSDFSVLEKILRGDAVYCSVDEPTRRAYASVCSEIASRLRISQSYVAQAAQRLGDISYYLMDRDGRRKLIQSLGLHADGMKNGTRLFWHLIIQFALTGVIVFLCTPAGVVPAILSAFPAFVLVNSLFMRIKAAYTHPVPVPRIEVKDSSPEKTVTAVSVLITDEKALNECMERLETHYLATRLGNTYYAILGDFPDAKTADETEDEQRLLTLAADYVRALNEKYSPDEDVFCFLMRKRTHNKADNVYMGYERKRGAVMQFFNLVKNDEGRGNYSLIAGNLPRDIKYALLLDADTVLPKEALSRLIGAALHPQNRAEVKDGRIIKGFGIFIPRMERLSVSETGFMHAHNGTGGISPYSSLVFDYYHDSFGEAIFGGKGLIDIDAFLECIRGRIDDNTVLSHDMLESSFVRGAYVSDVILYDSEPKTLISWWKRAHRWIRGDWQLLPYLFAKKGSPRHTSALTKWKIIDNIRRSLTPISILQSMLILPYYGMGLYVWLSLICAFEEALTASFSALIQHLRDGRTSMRNAALAWERCFLDFMSLPYAAARTIDAAWRAVHRTYFSHKKMLEWQTAAQSEKKTREKPLLYYAELWVCFWTGLRLLILPLFGLHGSILLGVFFTYAPFALRIYDTPFRKDEVQNQTKEYFETLTKDIWGFFKSYAGEEYGFIPPDNVQVYPAMPSCNNTSPTNIGMGLMAAVCAYDMKLIDRDEFIYRASATLDYIDSLEKWNGHLYNWYRIETGEKLSPAYVSTVDSGNLCACLLCLAEALKETRAENAIPLYNHIRQLVYDTDFSALFDYEKDLFYIGYDASRCTLTQSRYDLLASEARLTYLVACALCKIPQKAWTALGRTLTKTHDGRALLSWSGTMFEYLMPCIFTGITPDTLMDESIRAAVDEHISCAKTHPWGISESGYYAYDRRMYYQYRAFGAPAVGLAPVYSDEDVIAPYASCLAALIYPEKAAENLRRTELLGARGTYGFFEAIDYTPGRVQEGHTFEIVKSYMAHHQGMSICALTDVLTDGAFHKRFMHIPEMRTVALLCDEKIPDGALTLKSTERIILSDEDTKKHFTPPVYTHAARYPRGTLLTNGHMTAFCTDSGISYLRLGDVFLTRYRYDFVRGERGLFLFARDGEKVYCINTACIGEDKAEKSFTFESYRAQTEVSTDGLNIRTESMMSHGADAFIINITIINSSSITKSIQLGAFAEMSIASMQDDVAHPAFVNLTIDAERTDDGIIFVRRGTDTRPARYVYAAFSDAGTLRASADGLSCIGRHSCYTDAMRNNMLRDGRIKTPTEPVLCLRNELRVAGGESREILFILAAGTDRETVISTVSAQKSVPAEQTRSVAFAMDMSALRFMGITEGKAHILTRVASRIASGAGNIKVCEKCTCMNKDILFRHSVSGNLPIVTVEINSPTQFRMLKMLLSLLRFCTYKGERFDLIVIGRYEMSYRCDIKSYVTDASATFLMTEQYGEGTNLHIIDGYSLSDEEYRFIRMVSTLCIDASRSLDKQFHDEPMPEHEDFRIENNSATTKRIRGEFLRGGEYSFRLSADDDTPLPWSNIICNPQNEQFGTLTTECGGGYTWSGNCRETRLSPWYCDILHDTAGEMLLLTDDEGNIRTVTHSRMQGGGDVKVLYGFGYTKYENPDCICRADMTVFTDTKYPQKISLLELENTSSQTKRLTIRYMLDRGIGAHTEFSGGTAFMYAHDICGVTYINVQNADSVRFSGDREGELLFYRRKENVNSRGFMCLYGGVTIRANEKRSIILLLGTAANEESAKQAIEGITVQTTREKLSEIKAAWDKKLNVFKTDTPDESFNLLVNRRLLYQVYASRLYSRTGFYQSGGAFGFRDQLQDVLALLMTDPCKARGQILLCASMQFEKGDCLHWWHAPSRGVRTHITDDRLFLPLVTAEYVKATGDTEILNIRVPYLEDVPLADDLHDVYITAKHSQRDGTLYEHCLKSIFASDETGVHGLPLMGTGDWNDGMSSVGKDGGESVFLAFLLIVTAEKFMQLCIKERDAESIMHLRSIIHDMREAVKNHAWDGDRWRRAYFGDGTPLGTIDGKECSIDLLTQAWGVFAERISDRGRCGKAMHTAAELLYDDENGLIKLLSPAFSGQVEHYAGYIESYADGVRENGAQYTHAAVWYLIAACLLDYPDDEVMRIFRTLSPIEKDTEKYMAEPYVMAADVYSCDGYEGRGGWTWYTGSAAWMYFAAVKYVLGIDKEGNMLRVSPHNTWNEYSFSYKYGSSVYNVHVTRTDNGKKIGEIELCDDGRVHEVELGIGIQSVG